METVLITGALSGIGLATADLLAEKGYRVFGTTRSRQKRGAVIADLKQKHGDRLQFVEMDVTNTDSVKRAVAAVVQQAGGLDVLICNAGGGIYGTIEEMPLEHVQKQFDTNVFGYLRTLQAVLPHLRAKRAGRVVMVSSIAGVVSIPCQTHYSATKYAIEAFTEGLRQEQRQFGIKVSAVRPGDIRTNFNDVTLKHLPEKSPYKKLYDKCWEAIDKNMKAAPHPILVAKTIHRILRAKHPKTFYTAADFFTSLTPLLTPFMSSRLKEKVIRLFYGIDGVR